MAAPSATPDPGRLRPIPRRSLRAAVLGVSGLALGLAFSLRTVPEGKIGVRDSAMFQVSPVALEPGWHLLPRGAFRLTLYETGSSRRALGDPQPLRIRTREGANLEAAVELVLEVAPGQVISLHRESGGNPAAWLEDHLRSALTSLIGSPAFSTLNRGNLPKLEAATGRLVAEAAQSGGVEVRSLRFRRLGYEGAPLIAAVPRASLHRKVLWLAIDGFDWDIIRPLVAAGRMPNLARLMEEGASGNLQPVVPLLSPVIWTSVATGKSPEKHGIVDFVASDPKTGAVLPVTSTLRKTRAFWNILSDAGVSVGVIAWWASFPAEPIDGFMATDRIAYQLFKGRIRDLPEDNPLKTHPADLYRRIAPLIVPPSGIADAEVTRFIDLERVAPRLSADDRDRVNELRTVLASARTYAGIGMKLFAERPTDVRVIYFEGPDTAAHLFMPFAPPRAEGVPQEKVDWFGNVVPEFYAYQDEWIGRLAGAFADAETTLLISSDHGFKSGAARPQTESRISHGRAADWHEREGIVLFAGKDIRRGARILGASVLDLVPTLLALYGLPVAEDMDGKVLTAALTEEFFTAHPVGSIATYDTTGVSGGGAGAALARSAASADSAAGRAAADDEELLAKLQSLGYIQQSMPTADINQGTIAMEAGDFPGAIRALESALKRTDLDPARLTLARAYRLNGEEGKARREIDRLLAKSWNRAAVLAELAALHRGRKDWAGAERILRQALEADPKSAETLLHLARLFEQQQRWHEAQSWYEKAAAADPSRGDTFNQLGVILRTQGKIAEAIRQLEKAIEVAPDLPGPYNNLGLLYREKGLRDQARSVLETGATMAPDSAVLHNSLGSLYYDMGEAEKARREFVKALELNPDYAEAISNLATLYQAEQNAPMSEKYLARLVALEPANSEARLALSLVLMRQQKDGGASEVLRDLVDKEPANFRALVALGKLRLKQGQSREAVALLERAARIDTRVAPLWNDLAQAYLALGRPREARGAFERSLAIDPNQPEISDRLGRIRG